jgi:hypothetical protein
LVFELPGTPGATEFSASTREDLFGKRKDRAGIEDRKGVEDNGFDLRACRGTR